MKRDKADEKSMGIVWRCREQTGQSREFPWVVQEQQISDRRHIEAMIGDRMPPGPKWLIAASFAEIASSCGSRRRPRMAPLVDLTC